MPIAIIVTRKSCGCSNGQIGICNVSSCHGEPQRSSISSRPHNPSLSCPSPRASPKPTPTFANLGRQRPRQRAPRGCSIFPAGRSHSGPYVKHAAPWQPTRRRSPILSVRSLGISHCLITGAISTVSRLPRSGGYSPVSNVVIISS